MPQGYKKFSSEVLAVILSEEVGSLEDSRFAVGFSGGCDSQALLHAMSDLRRHYDINLLALHFDHGLNHDSVLWQEQCEQLCIDLKVPFFSHRQVIRTKAGESLEARAREARYAWFEQITDEDRVILTAHHFDDQVETVMLNLFNGRGVDSLTGMRTIRPLSYGSKQLLVRPLLQIPRKALEKYNQEHGLSWIRDPSNQSDTFDRNYLRNQIMPLIKERWPGAAKGIGGISQKLQRLSAVYQKHILESYRCCAEDSVRRLFCLGRSLSVRKLSELDRWDYVEVLRLWIHQTGNPSPSNALLEDTYRQISGGYAGAGGFQHQSYEVRNFANRLYLMSRLDHGVKVPEKISYDLGNRLFPTLGVKLVIDSCHGKGISEAKIGRGVVELVWRQGGERITLPGRDFQHQLKKIYQQYGIPPWERDRLPMIKVNARIVWVWGIGVLDDYQCKGSEVGFCPKFKPLDD
ncbi:MAG: tRNA lysidine(34) synthetase TilS [Gammaproteobacteria bacterium]|nr:tRNA lysidine(34) synthetase TilS [Gammaproteobacteria bacterium]